MSLDLGLDKVAKCVALDAHFLLKLHSVHSTLLPCKLGRFGNTLFFCCGGEGGRGGGVAAIKVYRGVVHACVHLSGI